MTTEPRFRKSGGGILKLSRAALAMMQSYLTRPASDFEAGGVLLGRYILDCSDVVVDSVTVPMLGDVRSRTGFLRRAKGHQAAVDQAWLQSMHTCNYLGRWHTHPGGALTPSSVDTLDWTKALRKEQFDSASLFFVLIASDAIAIWEGDKITRALAQLERA